MFNLWVNVLDEKCMVMNYLDRNEFSFEPSQKVVGSIKNMDPKTKTLCFHTHIYNQGKKSLISINASVSHQHVINSHRPLWIPF